MDTSQKYISDIEKGESNPSLETIIRYAVFFGVEYFEFANPKYPVPTFDQLPFITRKAIQAHRKKQQSEKTKVEQRKATNKAEGIPGRAKQLHALLESGFFRRSRTAKEAFIKLNPGVSKQDLGDYAEEITRITITLSQGKFLKLLDKLEPAPGTTAVRFVTKDPSVINYVDGPVGTKDIAADEG